MALVLVTAADAGERIALTVTPVVGATGLHDEITSLLLGSNGKLLP